MSAFERIHLSDQARNGAIEISVVTHPEEPSEQRYPNSFGANDPSQLGALLVNRLETMVVFDAQPQERADPFPIVRRIKFDHPKLGLDAVGQKEFAARACRKLARRHQLDVFDMLRPTGPPFDLRQMLPGGIKREIDCELAMDECEHIVWLLGGGVD